MKTSHWTLALFLLIVGAGPAVGLTVETLSLDDGRSRENLIASPVFDATEIRGVRIGEIESRLDADRFVAYRMSKSYLEGEEKYGNPRYKVAASIDLGSLLAQALGSEAKAMGLDTGGEGWQVSGTLHDLRLEIKQIFLGTTMFFGYMDVELLVRDETGQSRSTRMELYNMSRFYNAGFGMQDEVREALADLLIRSAQEIVARLNRESFGAPPHPEIAGAKLAGLGAQDESTMENDLLLIGLSGAKEAVPALVGMLPATGDEDRRMYVINALANLASPDAVADLSARYATEDEDCRYFTLKAMAYIGTPESMELIRKRGALDEDLPCRLLSSRALK